MNPPTQSPTPDHRARQRRIAGELLGLFLVSAGTIGLLGALYSAEPLAALFVAGLGLISGGRGVLRVKPPVPRTHRLVAGYIPLTLGLSVLGGLAFYLSLWVLLFGLLLVLGVYLSSEGA
ncbi:hypothetical protein ACFWRZ_08685 [Streptomyces rubiginosohelvolus]|uniref:hypothetical protein n=1 Tax=Streptomyces rubiginosohelvolus TaxID=67362 RepID=UPI00365D5C1C